jgi:hypothetical protein
MPAKSVENYRPYVLIAAIIGIFIMAEWISIFIFGHVPPGYP